jgi:hypothetical protein
MFGDDGIKTINNVHRPQSRNNQPIPDPSLEYKGRVSSIEGRREAK